MLNAAKKNKYEAPQQHAEPTVAAVEIASVDMDYGGASLVLSNVSLTLNEGEFLSIVGPSGCGKSTLLKLISGLETPASGTVRVRGKTVTDTPSGIGFMFQKDALLPWATVRENVAVGFDCAGVSRTDSSTRINELLAFVGLSDFGDHYPNTLSGGMRQRVALARILAYSPDIFLMDEPFGALDAQTKQLMGQELLSIWGRYQKGIIFVTHDIEEAVSLSDRVIVMTGRPGRIHKEYRIDLPRPRLTRDVRKNGRFHEIVDAIWSDIMAAKQAA